MLHIIITLQQILKYGNFTKNATLYQYNCYVVLFVAAKGKGFYQAGDALTVENMESHLNC